MDYNAGKYDVCVIGAGHAGCEAALASSRLGLRTILFSINLDTVANMPCNPSIGGTAKGHLVREIDALGGEMGKVADATFLQSRILNTRKGPAVYSLRVQSDRREYQKKMKNILENQENLDLKQAEVVEIIFENDMVKSVKTHVGAIYDIKSCIISTGTYLKSRIIIGDVSYEGGPDGMFPSNKLSECLKNTDIKLMRFKTGTPCRVNSNSIDFDKTEVQEGDDEITPFSFETDKELFNQVVCHLTYTNENTHKVILDNLHRSPLFSGDIEGVGPRYCPSIEDKVVRFKDKNRHQLFLEPMGLETNEIYVQGMDSTQPEDVKLKMLRTIKGLENVEIMRTAYAIEYDCIDPTELKLTLEHKKYKGLFGAGQFNGTSGYEEAASQGLVAGINAAHYILGKEPFILKRSNSYIGTLIDDLVTKGTNEPYRIMTSRYEYRLLLRQDNADIRLTSIGYELGLISEDRYRKFNQKAIKIKLEIERLKTTNVGPSEEIQKYLDSKESTLLKSGISLYTLLKRPEIVYKDFINLGLGNKELDRFEVEQVEIQIKYEGYIKRQKEQIERFMNMENKTIPENIDYLSIKGLRIEARQKLDKIKPKNLGQASRISGVSPADMGVLMIYLKQMRGKNER